MWPLWQWQFWRNTWIFYTCSHSPYIWVVAGSGLVCYNYLEGTQTRFAIDSTCSAKQKAHYLQGFADAQRMALHALRYPENGHGVDAMTMYMGKGAEKNRTFVTYATGA
jgi:hypothetical protein